jgi:hypothetical protein
MGENTFVHIISLIQLLDDLPDFGNGKDMPCLQFPRFPVSEFSI